MACSYDLLRLQGLCHGFERLSKVKIQGDNPVPLRCRLLRLERDIVAQGFEAPHQAALDGLSVALIEIGGPQVMVRFMIAQDMVDDDEDAARNGHGGALLALARPQA